MPRGQRANVGDTMVNANGYHNTRTETGWRFTHHLVAEEKLGRPLNGEQVRFKDGDKENISPDNIEVVPLGKASARKRLARIEAQIEELQAQRKLLVEELGGKS
jgi:hypothetical protein